MAWVFLDSTARSEWLAGTSQTGQLTALAELWSGDVELRFYTAADGLLGTGTHPGWDPIDTTTNPAKYSLTLQNLSGWTPSATGTATYVVAALPSSTAILRADLTASIAVIAGSRVNLDDAAGGAGLRLYATASLPTTPYYTPPGTFKTLGTETLSEHMTAERTASPEGLTAATTRMLGTAGFLTYCGAVVWNGKYALPVGGGHAGSYDDGFYAQDLVTGEWETVVPFSTVGSTSTSANTYGEWSPGTTPNRPAAQHTYSHLVVVGDDVIQGYGGAIGWDSGASRQAHRFRLSTGDWERYGTLSGGAGSVQNHVTYEAGRNRLTRIRMQANSSVIDTMPADDSAAEWTQLTITAGGRTVADINGAIGYFPPLDCYVRIDTGILGASAVLVMDAANLTAGWSSVGSTGTNPGVIVGPGLVYCPLIQGLVSVNQTEEDKLYYLKPSSGDFTDPWVWTSETFTGSTAASPWDNNNPEGAYQRIAWSDELQGLVVCKYVGVLTEVFTPTP